MKCNRCSNPMHEEWNYDPSGMIQGWGCAICGNYIDPIVEANRLHHDEPPKPANARGQKRPGAGMMQRSFNCPDCGVLVSGLMHRSRKRCPDCASKRRAQISLTLNKARYWENKLNPIPDAANDRTERSNPPVGILDGATGLVAPANGWGTKGGGGMKNDNIPDGKTCKDCVHFKRCRWLINIRGWEVMCDFIPSRFSSWNEATQP